MIVLRSLVRNHSDPVKRAVVPALADRLAPLARGDADLFDQTQRLVEEVLPVVHAWD